MIKIYHDSSCKKQPICTCPGPTWAHGLSGQNMHILLFKSSPALLGQTIYVLNSLYMFILSVLFFFFCFFFQLSTVPTDLVQEKQKSDLVITKIKLSTQTATLFYFLQLNYNIPEDCTVYLVNI